MGRAGDNTGAWRSVATTLVALVLLFRFLAPPGYMIDAQAPSHGLVICTGHGPLALGGQDPAKAPAQKSSDAACVGAGNVTPITPAVLAAVSDPVVLVAERTGDEQAFDLIPGRGLAAPPPRSHAPPAVSI